MEIREFLIHAEIDAEILEAWCESGWLAPQGAREQRSFSDVDLARARLICDLQRRLGVNDEAVPIILHLVDQVHGLRRMMAEVRRLAADGTARD